MTDITKNIKITLFGESHGTAVGAVVEGLPSGEAVDYDLLSALMKARAPGNDPTATKRKEADEPIILSGVKDGILTGAPLAVIVYNSDARSYNYDNVKHILRPGHSDLSAYLKYKGFNDVRGGGHFSARITAPLVAAGSICLGILNKRGIQIAAHILKVKDILDVSFDESGCSDEVFKTLQNAQFPVISKTAEQEMRRKIDEARLALNSVGGVVECAVKGLPVGTGAPHLNGLDSAIAKIIFGLPAVKGLEFGSGFMSTDWYGTENNDQLYYDGDCIAAKTNHAGGVLGGITYGAPVVFRAAFKPTPSVAAPQYSVNVSAKQDAMLSVEGRHDPCVVLRAVPVVVAATAIAVLGVLEEDL